MVNEYDKILSRISVRRYKTAKLAQTELSELKEFICQIRGLIFENNFICNIYDYGGEEGISSVLGTFGKIFRAPHFLAPYITGIIHSSLDLGYRSQEIVLELWKKGIGSCYIGCIHNQRRVKNSLHLPENATIISTIVFGFPSEDQSKYLYQKISQIFTRSKSRLEPSRLFINHTNFKQVLQNEIFNRIIEAGRYAPSATNTQPWRFDIQDDWFIMYAKRKTIGKIYDLDQEYIFHDTGICMANMSHAAQALGKQLNWELLEIGDQLIKNNLLPVARFSIKEILN